MIIKRLWEDDDGAVQSTEMVLIMGLLLMGPVIGMVHLRDGVIRSFRTTGDRIEQFAPKTVPGFSFSETKPESSVQSNRSVFQYPSP